MRGTGAGTGNSSLLPLSASLTRPPCRSRISSSSPAPPASSARSCVGPRPPKAHGARPPSRTSSLQGPRRSAGRTLRRRHPRTVDAGPALHGVELVFHAAAQSAYWRHPQDVLGSAVEGTRNVVQAAARPARAAGPDTPVAALGMPAPANCSTSRTLSTCRPAVPLRLRKEPSRKPPGEPPRAISSSSSSIPASSSAPATSIASAAQSFSKRRGAWRSSIPTAASTTSTSTTSPPATWRQRDRGRPGERYILGGENLTHRQALTEIAGIVGRRPPWLRLPMRRSLGRGAPRPRRPHRPAPAERRSAAHEPPPAVCDVGQGAARTRLPQHAPVFPCSPRSV